jgi:hypothetical protein
MLETSADVDTRMADIEHTQNAEDVAIPTVERRLNAASAPRIP